MLRSARPNPCTADQAANAISIRRSRDCRPRAHARRHHRNEVQQDVTYDHLEIEARWREALPYWNVDISTFYPYGDVTFPE
jgi:hypothetical protein